MLYLLIANITNNYCYTQPLSTDNKFIYISLLFTVILQPVTNDNTYDWDNVLNCIRFDSNIAFKVLNLIQRTSHKPWFSVNTTKQIRVQM